MQKGALNVIARMTIDRDLAWLHRVLELPVASLLGRDGLLQTSRTDRWCLLGGRPCLRLIVLVDDQVFRTRWEHPQRFEEFNHGVLFVRTKTLKRLPRFECLA